MIIERMQNSRNPQGKMSRNCTVIMTQREAVVLAESLLRQVRLNGGCASSIADKVYYDNIRIEVSEADK